jgi:DNA-binding winged helix-turn-helix (wHTH) protein
VSRLISRDDVHGHQDGERTGPIGHPVVRFGTFDLDRTTGELWSNGQRVPLQDQPAQLLSLLVGRPGMVVMREELRKALWSKDTFVDFDTALNVAVNKIRQALRDSASTPRFIETVPKRGYRFLADVHPARAGAAEPGVAALEPPPAPVGPPRDRRLWMAIGAAAAAVVALGTWRHS